jgi:hypothetical protein
LLGSEVSFPVATEVSRESNLVDVGRTAIFSIEVMERLRIDIARHANKNGCVRSHDQEVFEGKTTLEGS